MKKTRVLIADDNSDIRALLRMTLSLAGMEVVGEAENGRQAVDLASELTPDALVLDVSMPIMDGLEALPLIRETSPETKVVVYSAYVDQRDEALELGADGYVEKTAPAERLIEEILRLAS